MSLIASLGMYDTAETAAANDRLWAGIHRILGYGPARLSRDGDLWGHWMSPDLLFSQTCGMPYRTRLHGKVQIVGTPDYGLPDCVPGQYYSVLIRRRGDMRDLQALAQGTLGYNEALSQSGWAAAYTHLTQRGLEAAHGLQTGGHSASIAAVLSSAADFAAIDAVTWALYRRCDPRAAELEVFDNTEPTPALPYITSMDQDASALRGALAQAIADLSEVDRTSLHLNGIVDIPASAYLSVANPPAPPAST